jgi:hypothetical protein
MTPEGQRLARAVRNTEKLQTVQRYLRTVTLILNEVTMEVVQELEAARNGVLDAEQAKPKEHALVRRG